MSGRVELVPDSGAAATSHDFFRCESFLRAEGVTHSLIVETNVGRAVSPIVVRTIPGMSFCDGISPYGYPGGLLEGAPPDVRDVDLSGIGLVSIFLRDRLGAPSLTGGSQRGTVFLHDPAKPRELSRSFRRDVRRNEHAGFRVELLAGWQVNDEILEWFCAAYAATMQYLGADDRYFFSQEYLQDCLRSRQCWLSVVRSPKGNITAGELVVSSDGTLHSYLACTAPMLRHQSPGKNAVVRLIELADELGMCLNFGGGLMFGDHLAASKRSYSNATATFVTHEIICMPSMYAELVDGLSDTSFFPQYRGTYSRVLANSCRIERPRKTRPGVLSIAVVE